MNCLLVCPGFPRMPGGVADYTLHLAQALAAAGAQPAVLTSRDPRVVDAPGVRLIAAVDGWNRRALPTILSTIRTLRPDAVCLQYVPYLYSRLGVPLYLVALATRIRDSGVPLVTTFHEVAVRITWSRPKYWGVAPLQRWIGRTLLGCSRAAVVTIPFHRQLLGADDRRVRRVPVGSNFPARRLSEAERAELRKELGFEDAFVIATLGTNLPWRRLDLLLDAVRRAGSNTARRLRVLVLGGRQDGADGERRRLVGWIASRRMDEAVRFTGYLEAGALARHLSAADIFALLDNDPYGGVSLKSTALAAGFAAGLPIFGNRGTLTDDLLEHGRNIYLVQTLDVDEVARSLLQLVGDDALRRSLAEGSAATYERHMAWPVIARSYLSLFEPRAPA